MGQSECSHNDDIGIRCTGIHAESWMCIGMRVCHVFLSPSLYMLTTELGHSINIFMHVHRLGYRDNAGHSYIIM